MSDKATDQPTSLPEVAHRFSEAFDRIMAEPLSEAQRSDVLTLLQCFHYSMRLHQVIADRVHGLTQGGK